MRPDVNSPAGYGRAAVTVALGSVVEISCSQEADIDARVDTAGLFQSGISVPADVQGSAEWIPVRMPRYPFAAAPLMHP